VNVQEVLAQATDSMAVKRVYGEPYEKDGVTVIPAARIRGGGGGGGDTRPEANSKGGRGAGFGLVAAPAGALIIAKDGSVRWEPAMNLNRVIMGGQLIAVVALLVLWSWIRSRQG